MRGRPGLGGSPPWTLSPRQKQLVVVVLAVLALPAFVLRPRADLDASWKLGLALAAHHHLPYGSRIDFTYGPLGFLAVPVEIAPLQPFLGLIFGLGVGICLFALLTHFLGRYLSTVEVLVLDLALAVSWGLWGGLPEETTVVSALAVLWLLPNSIRKRPPPPFVFVLAGFLAAPQLLIKLGSGLVACALGMLLGVAWRPRLRHVGLVAASELVGLAVSWIVAGQSLGDLLPWLRRAVPIVSGYDAMSVSPGGLNSFEVLVLASPVFLALLFGLVMWPGRGGTAAYLSLVVVAGTAFFVLKESLVRFDTPHFALLLPGLATLAAIAPWKRAERVLPLAAGVTSIALLSLVLGSGLPPRFSGSALRHTLYTTFANRAGAAADVYRVVGYLVDPGYGRSQLASSRVQIRGTFGIPSTVIESLSGDRVAADPWDVAALWAYGLSWDPVPVFQTYSAYTALLDQTNADALTAPGGPDGILESPNAIDGRYWLWESPAYQVALACSFVSIASGYGSQTSPIGSGPRVWQALIRTANACGRPKSDGEVTAQPGQTVQIPQPSSPDEIVMATFDLPDGPLQRIESLVARPFQTVLVQFDGGREYRMVAGTAMQPHLLVVPGRVGNRVLPQGSIDHRSIRLSNTQGPVTIRFTEEAVSSMG